MLNVGDKRWLCHESRNPDRPQAAGGKRAHFTIGLVMKERIVSLEQPQESRYNPRFLPFIELFTSINGHKKLFPKVCRTCGRTFESLARYLWCTVAKGHCLEDAEEVMSQPYTMTYRHCSCGNTLVLTFTEETYPKLSDLWAMLRKVAEDTHTPLTEVVQDFSEQWERYMTTHCEVPSDG